MSDFWLILIVGLLVYQIIDKEKEKKQPKEKNIIQDSLPDLIDKYCEIGLREWLPYINSDYTLKGIIKDIDDTWLTIEVTKKTQKHIKVIRKSMISSIKVIQ